jgi:8-oxo-dGTP pyrophosphatase MutT (NUDIX family)
MTEKLAARLRDALADEPREPLFPGDDPRGVSGAGTPAAVLIAVTNREEPGVILTVRRNTLRTHAGQVAFPGGRIDAGEDAIAAAVREAWEELELDPQVVSPVASLETYRTITNYDVTPVLAAVPPDLALAPHDLEVADWFEAPLGHLMDPANQQLRSVLFEGAERHYYEIPWQGRRIWGATAAMLVNLSRRLRWP